MRAFVGLIGSSLALAGFSAPTTAAGENFEKNVRFFIEEHCVGCHGPETTKADLRLDKIDSDLAGGKDAETWELVLEQLSAGEMPPKKRRRPDPDQVAAVTDWIGKNLESAGQLLAEEATRGTIRRLNRTEYANTIRDLFGIEFEAGLGFPQDDSAHGFDNVGEALTLSPLLLEKYLHEAERITERILFSERAVTVKKQFPGTELVYGKSPHKRDGEKVTFYMVGRSNGGGAFFSAAGPLQDQWLCDFRAGKIPSPCQSSPDRSAGRTEFPLADCLSSGGF